MTASARYAIYYAPDAAGDLWRLGSRVIGYNAVTGSESPCDVPGTYTPTQWRVLVGEASKYGFHATLKAPFRLAAAVDRDGLLEAVRLLASRTERVPIGQLEVAPLGSYVALLPREQSIALADCAQSIVEALEPYRAALTPQERERRKPELLSARQLELLDRYGYPFVADEFRFHMTLAGPLPVHEKDAVIEELANRCRAIESGAELWLDRIAVFEQPAPECHFRVIASHPLG